MLKLTAFLWRDSWLLVGVAVLTSMASGACSIGVIALINSILSRPDVFSAHLIGLFIGLCLANLVGRAVAQYLLTSVAQKSIARLRQHLCQRIMTAPLYFLEQLGPPRIVAILVDDTLAITDALHAVPLLVVNAAILVGCMIYLAWLSWPVFCGLGLFVVVGALGARILRRQAIYSLCRAREEQNVLFSLLRALTDGVKELKLNRERREAFLGEDVKRTTEALQDHHIVALVRFLVLDIWSQALLYTMIGLALFVLPRLSASDATTLGGYVLTILYAMRPMVAITNMLPAFSRARVALDHVRVLDSSLAEHTEIVTARKGMTLQEAPLKCIRLDGVTYRYQGQEEHQFILGPINVTLRPSETVFIAGGNGSGKSTLAKLLCGLYVPETGVVKLNGTMVTDETRDDYRQLFAVVFGEPYVFATLHGPGVIDQPGAVQGRLQELGLERKVRILDGILSTTALSQGERRRLALLAAYMEDRPVYVFDEWAANQDPRFKDLFYRHMVPELAARGKAVVVITHDERYFHVADRVIRMDEGQIIDDDDVTRNAHQRNGRLARP